MSQFDYTTKVMRILAFESIRSKALEDRELDNRENRRSSSEIKAFTNEEITAAILKIEENLAKITKMISDDKKAKPDPDDVKVNELAKLRASLKDFRPYS
jgi:hypothetical protein